MTSLRLHPADNVEVARTDLAMGDVAGGCRVKEIVPAAHKIAIETIAKGEPVRKYGQIIGYASEEITAGDHVHRHNLIYGAAPLEHDFCADYRPVEPVPDEECTRFDGYHRANGAVGTRNMIAVLSMVNCSAVVARRIARAFTPDVLASYANVDGVAAFTSGTGCGMSGSGEGFDMLQRVIWGYARNPNIGGVLLVGLGCEINQIDFLLDAYGISPGPAFQVMNIQTLGGTARTIRAGVERIRDMLPEVNRATRRPAPVSRLMLGLQCGGSDGLSGITANPALGHACDLLVGQGSAVVLSETPEIYGAEHLLTRRAASPRIARKLLARVAWWEDYVARNKGSMDNNPSPGNKAGGLTTILEKSLGAVAKGGTTGLNGVYDYAEPIDASGLVFMDSPGYDPVSVTGQIASGCNLVCFTTGRGSILGSKPAPTIKIATNTTMFRHMAGDMDIDAGRIVSEGVDVERVGREIFDRIVRVASGQATVSEAQGLGEDEFVPWQIGATM
jgi:altronate hydrolase